MNKRVLLLLGCPEVPVQTSIALYLASRLKNAGMDVFVAGTDAALDLIIIFGNDAESLSGEIDFKCDKIVARTVHNPNPLKKKIEEKIKEVKRWAVSN
ncbi:MAG: DUF1890 family protein [Candidatus Methanospirareceae archaeon]